MSIYSCRAVENLINEYREKDGEFFQIEEGSLGWGFCILYDWTGHLKTYIINEVYLNEWSSGHKVRAYNKIPKKYQKILENL